MYKIKEEWYELTTIIFNDKYLYENAVPDLPADTIYLRLS